MSRTAIFGLISLGLAIIAWVFEMLHYRFFGSLVEKSWLTNLSLLVMGGAVAFFALFVFEISKNL